ncbi:MAG: tetratricopeptide repeat protein [Burkholderiales bacterium]|nr:tetratricopeptide repeat protein [Burkholderiales bacterium]
MRLRLFGPPQAETGAAPPAGTQALPNERRSQLVAWLALKRAWAGRRELAALLWPDQESKLAFANLRKALHRLQPAPWAAGLEAQGQALRFCAATDVQEFEAALAEGRLDDALALGQGELLQGFDDPANGAWTEWLQFERERMRTAWRGAALARLEQPGLVAGEAEALAARLVAADALDEAAVAAQMQVLARGGQLGSARAAFRAYAERLQRELGIAPGMALKALHDGLANVPAGPAGPAGPAAAGTSAAPSAAATASPAPAGDPDPGFVGRTTELRRIGELLAQDDCQVLCLIGPGGVGKTRLARHAQQAMAAGFADGAAFIALEDVASTAEVGTQLAAALGLALSGKGAPLDEVRGLLAPRHALLVLDNFEQLAAEAAWLDEFVRAAPRLQLIITSRVRPLAQCVWALPIEGLPCPEAEDEDRLDAFDAARLFVRAAQRVEPALVPAAEAAAIVDICRQVEGLPLALELAASFTRVLSCSAIAAELREGTELLRAADPARPARQASMEAVFEQSWRHLADAERAALARLAVFRGGFSAAAARRVAGASLPVLAALADKSLLRKDGARCQLHPLLQQFALQRLDEQVRGPERLRLAAAHSSHFLRWMAEVRPPVRHAERKVMQELDAEFENVRTAWHHGALHGPADVLAGACYSLMSYCDHRARRAEGLAMLREAMQGELARRDERLAAVLAGSAAHLEARLDRYAEAEALALRALAVAERVGDLTTQQQTTTVLGAATARLGRLDDAKRWFERTLRLAEQAADGTHRAATFDNLALIERIRGRLDESLALYRQGLAQHREIGDAGGEAQCLNNLGVVHILRNELAPAREVLQAARRLCERHGLASIRSMVEVNLANVAMQAGDHEAARTHAAQALETSLANGQRGFAIDARLALGTVALQGGDLDEAREQLRAAMETALPMQRPAMLVQLTRIFAELLAAQGEQAVAVRVMGFALQQRPGLVGAERLDAEARMRGWGAPATQAPAWTGPALEALAERIVVEAPLAHAPLIAELRGA